jgi:exopolysaccharide biosynthesis polyprenyl glycosylphosphotransferase
MPNAYVAGTAEERRGTVASVHGQHEVTGIESRARRARRAARALLFADAIAVAVALALVGPGTVSGWSGVDGLLSRGSELVAWLLVFSAYGLYARGGRRVSHSTLDEAPTLFHAALVGTLVVFGVHALGWGDALGVGAIAVFAGTALAFTAALRVIGRAAAARVLQPETALLVMGSDLGDVIARKLRCHPEYRLRPIGIVAPRGDRAPADGLPVLGDLAALGQVVGEHTVECVVASAGHLEKDAALELLRRCRELNVKLALVPTPFEALGPAVEVDDIEGVTVLTVSPPALTLPARVLKRTVDVVGAVTGMVFMAPLLVAAAVAIRVDSTGPILFKQPRVGRGGRRFALLKFRSMSADAEARTEDLRAQSKDPNWLHLESDPRITRVGNFLRQTSIDELPQLWNVLKGEMSLVGPRPLIVSEDQLISGHARSRLELAPGITGSWQVLGRTNIPFAEMVTLDYLYVMNWTFWGDLKLILKTVPVVLKRSGAN